MSHNVVTVTEEAASRVRDIVKNSDGVSKGIRISLKKGGCVGVEYVVDLVTDPVVGDDMVEKDGAKIWIDPSALLYLIGTEIGYETTKFHSGFSFHNPNQISSCGCGQSIELKRADFDA
ncbi:iron-sulfur cluster assembly accessory protein [Liberibacter sp. Z1]|nr:iron-sulfur cluster assembly accessory protein [Candidatus Liberibacter sp.]MBA5723858.1 iron-sulfur cluster assembly accessory protein [Candidatus Liberibacter sp.]